MVNPCAVHRAVDAVLKRYAAMATQVELNGPTFARSFATVVELAMQVPVFVMTGYSGLQDACMGL